jgi:hypothetical protein
MANGKTKHVEGEFHYWDIGTGGRHQRNPGLSQFPEGFGQSKLIADNSAEDGRAKNRRVERVKQ